MEHEGGELLFGQVGLCLRANEKSGKILLMSDANKQFHIEPKHCIEVTPKLKHSSALLSCRSISQSMKLQMLGRFGILDVLESAFAEKMMQKDNPDDSNIQLWMVLLEFSFPRLSFCTYAPQLLHTFFEESKSKSSEAFQRISESLKQSMSRFQLNLFPIHCPQSDEHPDGHWTLLAIESDNGEDKVRYYDF